MAFVFISFYPRFVLVLTISLFAEKVLNEKSHILLKFFKAAVNSDCLAFSVTATLMILIFFSSPLFAEELLCGIDRLEASHCLELSGLRVALVTNAAGVTGKGEPNYAMMIRNGVKLKFLMAPEHGFSMTVEAGKAVGTAIATDTLPVFSLYGTSKKPDIGQLRKIDLLIFDLQDIGTRCYTYISTMKNAMEACEQAGTAFMVLDRPNPIAALGQSGFVLQEGYESFVGAVEIPFVHAMTVGEIAVLLKKQHYPGLDLQVIPLQGYHRNSFADEYQGFHFRSPSPNIKDVDTAIVYPATVFLEATTVSEGRGTDAPFQQFGAPFIRSNKLLEALTKYHLAGVVLEQVAFIPRSSKFKGERCEGLIIKVTNRRAFAPFETATALLLELQRLYPEDIGLDKRGRFFDQLAGTHLFRQMIKQQSSLESIMEASRQQIKVFARDSVAQSSLYP